MTRINVGIFPQELPTKLLLAEHREIKRIPNVVKSKNINLKDIPIKFALGTGHVRFFYNKLLYLRNRYYSIYDECVNRNLNITCYGDSFENIPKELFNDYLPTKEDREILIERITSKGFVLLV